MPDNLPPGFESIPNPDMRPGEVRQLGPRTVEAAPGTLNVMAEMLDAVKRIAVAAMQADPAALEKMSAAQRNALRAANPTRLQRLAVEIGGGVPGLFGPYLAVWRNKRGADLELQAACLGCGPEELALLALQPWGPAAAPDSGHTMANEVRRVAAEAGVDPQKLLDMLADCNTTGN